eukprot:249782_1
MSVTISANVPQPENRSIPSNAHIAVHDVVVMHSVQSQERNKALKECKMEDRNVTNAKGILEWENITNKDDAQSRKNRNRINLLTKLVSTPILDISSLRCACWRGIPQSMRSTIWKLLLGYIPHKLSRRQAILARKRFEYFDLMERYYIAIDKEHRSDQENEALIQIEKDVDRMDTLFQIPHVKTILTRALYIWSLKHTATGYVQGINDLITPFLYIFLNEHVDPLTENDLLRIEADSYWCLDHLMEALQMNYIDNQPGITAMLQQLEYVIRRMNSKLYQHLKRKGVEFFQFAYRWMNCLLMRELSLRQIIRLWDTYLCEGVSASCVFTEFHVFVCAALLLSFEEELMDKEFDEIVIFLQNIKHKTSDWSDREIETVLSQAFVYQQMFGKNNKSLLF